MKYDVIFCFKKYNVVEAYFEYELIDLVEYVLMKKGLTLQIYSKRLEEDLSDYDRLMLVLKYVYEEFGWTVIYESKREFLRKRLSNETIDRMIEEKLNIRQIPALSHWLQSLHKA